MNKRPEWILPNLKKAQVRTKNTIERIDSFIIPENAKFIGNGKKYYISKDNLAWGIIVPTQFKWPLEYTKIQNAYKQFAGWVTSGGVNNTKWWNDFDNTKVFQTNKN